MGNTRSNFGVKLLEHKTGRQINVQGMAYAPSNEQGVVFLFGRLASKLGFCVESVQVHCPDCMARRKGKLHKIEFEYYASHFEVHRHDPKGVNTIVCWENDWEPRAKKFRHLKIIDLKRYCGVEPSVFSAGCADAGYAEVLKGRKMQWNIPLNAQVGDLVVIYRSYKKPHAIHDAWKVVGPFYRYSKNNRADRRPGMQPFLKCVARLKNPITYEEMKRDKRTRDLGVVKGRFQSARDISDDWPQLYDKIVELNPGLSAALKSYCRD
jgi:hypothetical protein